MKTFLAVVCFSSVLSAAFAQFPNGRFLEPPVAALCAQRVIHERAPDNKGYVELTETNNHFPENNYDCHFFFCYL